MLRKTWFLLGAGFGLIVPILLNVIQRIGAWQVRPAAYALFRPGLIALYVVPEQLWQGRLSQALFVGLVILLANVLVFGAAAYALRYGFTLLIAVLLAINLISLPPSDAKLEKSFSAQRQNFDRLIQKANQPPLLVRISGDEIEDINGRKYRNGDLKSPLSADLWREYRELLQKTAMKRGLYRSPQTGEMQFLTVSVFGKIGPIGTVYGYVYCPTKSNAVESRLLPCREQKNEYDEGDYRYKRLAPGWFIVEIFQTRSLIN